MKWPSNLRGQILPYSVRYVLSFILGVKWVPKIKDGPFTFVVERVWGFLRDGEVARAKCRSPSPRFEGNQMATHLLLFIKHNKNHLEIQRLGEISRFAICSEAGPTQWRVACAKPSGKSFSHDKITDSKKGTMLIATRHLKQVVHHLNPNY